MPPTLSQEGRRLFQLIQEHTQPTPVLHLALLPYQRIPALVQIYVQTDGYRSGCQSDREKLFIGCKAKFSSIYSTISLQRVKPKALGITGTGEGHRHTFQCHLEK